MEKQRSYHLKFLREEFAQRRHKNPQFSLRAFAVKLGINSGALSHILSGKRVLSVKLGQKILNKLNCSPKEEQLFLLSIARAQITRSLKRRDPKVRTLIKSENNQNTTTVLDQTIYNSIAEWYHAAILEMSYKKDFKADPVVIAKLFGIPVHEATTALKRLFDLGLLESDGTRVFKKHSHIDGNNLRITNRALQRKQKQIREKAIEAIEEQPTDRRYMTSITMCIDPDLLEEAKHRIDEFNDSLCAFLESGERKEVYTMELSLFSLEKKLKVNH